MRIATTPSTTTRQMMVDGTGSVRSVVKQTLVNDSLGDKMSRWIGGGMDHMNGSLFFWIGNRFHVLAGIPDKHSAYVKIGNTHVYQSKDGIRVERESET